MTSDDETQTYGREPKLMQFTKEEKSESSDDASLNC